MTQTVLVALLVIGVLVSLWVLWGFLAARSRDSKPVERTAYARGLNCLISGDRRGALIAFREAVTEDTTNTDAYLRLGDLLRQAGETGKALLIHRDLSVRSSVPNSDRERIYESLTRDYIALERYDEAVAAARKLQSVSRKNRYALLALTEVHEARGEWDLAFQAQEQLARLEGANEPSRLAAYHGHVASRLLEEGQTKEGRRRFEAALALDPGCVLASLELGDLLMEEGDPAGAVERWKNVALAEPARAAAVFERLERAYFEMGRFVEVIRFYEDLLKKASRDAQPPILLALSEIEMRRGDYEAAEDLIREALEIDPQNLVAHRNMLRVHHERGNSSEALATIDRTLKAIRVDPNAVNCRRCGAILDRPRWRCPSCAQWMPGESV